MFDIEYKGGNGVIISTKKQKIVIDGKLSHIGLKDLDVKDSISLSTEARFEISASDAALTIQSPGEFEIGDVSIKGIAMQRHLDTADQFKNGIGYRIEIGGVKIALFGNVDQKLSEEQLEAFGVIDIIILPVGGGGYTLDATSAVQIARSIDAKAIIPVHYADSAITYEVPQDSLDTFVKEYRVEVEQTVKYKVKTAASLPSVPTIIEITRS